MTLEGCTLFWQSTESMEKLLQDSMCRCSDFKSATLLNSALPVARRRQGTMRSHYITMAQGAYNLRASAGNLQLGAVFSP
jgi:hypothetical protein